jgi:hypothetical protein
MPSQSPLWSLSAVLPMYAIRLSTEDFIFSKWRCRYRRNLLYRAYNRDIIKLIVVSPIVDRSIGPIIDRLIRLTLVRVIVNYDWVVCSSVSPSQIDRSRECTWTFWRRDKWPDTSFPSTTFRFSLGRPSFQLKCLL